MTTRPLLRLAALTAFAAATAAAMGFGVSEHAIAEETSRNVTIVFDGSGSMWGQIDGRTKLEIARETLAGTLGGLPIGTSHNLSLGLIAYGHRVKGQCSDIETLVPVGDARETAQPIIDAVDAINPKGKTPLSDAVRRAAEDMRYTEDAATVVLITDGIETCDADPCALGRELEAAGIDFTAHVVGFGLSEAEGRQVACLADATGGLYLPAGDGAGLRDALSRSFETAAAPPPPAEPQRPDRLYIRVYTAEDGTAPLSRHDTSYKLYSGTTILGPDGTPIEADESATIPEDLLLTSDEPRRATVALSAPEDGPYVARVRYADGKVIDVPFVVAPDTEPVLDLVAAMAFAQPDIALGPGLRDKDYGGSGDHYLTMRYHPVVDGVVSDVDALPDDDYGPLAPGTYDVRGVYGGNARHAERITLTPGERYTEPFVFPVVAATVRILKPDGSIIDQRVRARVCESTYDSEGQLDCRARPALADRGTIWVNVGEDLVVDAYRDHQAKATYGSKRVRFDPSEAGQAVTIDIVAGEKVSLDPPAPEPTTPAPAADHAGASEPRTEPSANQRPEARSQDGQGVNNAGIGAPDPAALAAVREMGGGFYTDPGTDDVREACAFSVTTDHGGGVFVVREDMDPLSYPDRLIVCPRETEAGYAGCVVAMNEAPLEPTPGAAPPDRLIFSKLRPVEATIRGTPGEGLVVTSAGGAPEMGRACPDDALPAWSDLGRIPALIGPDGPTSLALLRADIVAEDVAKDTAEQDASATREPNVRPRIVFAGTDEPVAPIARWSLARVLAEENGFRASETLEESDDAAPTFTAPEPGRYEISACIGEIEAGCESVDALFTAEAEGVAEPVVAVEGGVLIVSGPADHRVTLESDVSSSDAGLSGGQRVFVMAPGAYRVLLTNGSGDAVGQPIMVPIMAQRVLRLPLQAGGPQ